MSRSVRPTQSIVRSRSKPHTTSGESCAQLRSLWASGAALTTKLTRDKRTRRDDGMVLCNPRDKEAAHRAEMEGIATDDRAVVTCRKCLEQLYKRDKARPNKAT